jgi:hypothetical protein
MNLANALMWSPGGLPEAKKLTHGVIASSTQELGPTHVSTLHAQNNLALMMHLGGAPSRDLYRATIAGYEEQVGPSPRFTLNAKLGLALVLDDTEETEEARTLFETVVCGFEANGMEDTMPLVEAAVCLTEHKVEQGATDDQLLANLTALLDTCTACVGPVHRIAAYATSVRGMLLHRRGQLDEAEAELRVALARQQSIHGDEFVYTQKTQRRLDALLAAS